MNEKQKEYAEHKCSCLQCEMQRNHQNMEPESITILKTL
jgi:hypothetical protein